MSSAKDLTKEPPRSPRERLGAYGILGRTLDEDPEQAKASRYPVSIKAGGRPGKNAVGHERG